MKTKDAAAYFGSQIRLAKALFITKQAVSGWGGVVPLGRAYQIEILTGGQIKAPRPAPDAAPAARDDDQQAARDDDQQAAA